jgi:hypothetical protein
MYECGPPVAVRLTQEVGRLRTILVRVGVLSHSTYLPAGYALTELFVVLAFCTVGLAKYASPSVGYMVIVGTTIIYGGMLRLIRDIDDPFEFPPIGDEDVAHGQSGSTEVDISCLLDYRRTLYARINADVDAERTLRSASRRNLVVTNL